MGERRIGGDPSWNGAFESRRNPEHGPRGPEGRPELPPDDEVYELLKELVHLERELSGPDGLREVASNAISQAGSARAARRLIQSLRTYH